MCGLYYFGFCNFYGDALLSWERYAWNFSKDLTAIFFPDFFWASILLQKREKKNREENASCNESLEFSLM